jgi:hypothetical protein
MKLFLAVSLVLALASAVRATDKICTLKNMASLDARTDENGGLLVPARIEGRDVWMALRLGNGLPVLYAEEVAGWNLKTGTVAAAMGITDGNGKPLTTKVTVKELRLEQLIYKDWEMLLVSRGNSSIKTEDEPPVVGTITSRFLLGVDTELNLAQNKINLFAWTPCRVGGTYWAARFTTVPFNYDTAGLITFPLELDNEQIQTSFNTGARISVINNEVTQKYFGFDENSPGIETEAQAHGPNLQSFRAMALTAKELEITDAKVVISHWNRPCHPDRNVRGLPGISCPEIFNLTPFAIGTDLLKKLRVYIAARDRVIFFTRVDQSGQIGGPDAAAPAR